MAKKVKERKRGNKRKSEGISKATDDVEIDHNRDTKRSKTANKDLKDHKDHKELDGFVPGRLEPELRQPSHQHVAMPGVSQQAAFGDIDPNTQEYFSGIETAINEAGFSDPDERRLFLENVYAEVNGNELQLAVNASCSRFLEKLIQVSDDFQLRVLFDKVCGHIEKLSRHRYASHVIQTILTCAADTVDREQRGEVAQISKEDQEGTLPTMEQLILNMCTDLDDVFIQLLTDAFGSHVLRVLMLLLAGRPIDEKLRSKKSVHYNKRNKIRGESKKKLLYFVPPSFTESLNKIVDRFATGLDDNALRHSTIDPISSPVIQLVIEFETLERKGDLCGGLIDRLLEGLFSLNSDRPPRHDFVETLMRDSTGSHVIEKIINVLPNKGEKSAFEIFYSTYFKGRLSKLASHGVANFSVQRVIERISNKDRAEHMISELENSFGNLMFNSREGVIKALIDLSVRTGAAPESIINGISSAYPDAEDKIVELILLKKNAKEYQDDVISTDYQIGGSQVLQALLCIPAAHDMLQRSFEAQHANVIKAYATSPIASKALEAYLKCDIVTADEKVKVIQHLTYDLAKDKSGSHLIEAAWDVLQQSEIEIAYEIFNKLKGDLESHRSELERDFFGKIVIQNTIGNRDKKWGWGYHGERRNGHQHDFQPKSVAKMPTLLAKSTKDIEEKKKFTITKQRSTKRGEKDQKSKKSDPLSKDEAKKKRKDMFKDILDEVDRKFNR